MKNRSPQVTLKSLFMLTAIAAILLAVAFYTQWQGLFITLVVATLMTAAILFYDRLGNSPRLQAFRIPIRYGVLVVACGLPLVSLLSAFNSASEAGRGRVMVPVEIYVFAKDSPVSNVAVQLTQRQVASAKGNFVFRTNVNAECVIPYEFVFNTSSSNGNHRKELVIDKDLDIVVETANQNYVVSLAKLVGERLSVTNVKAAKLIVPISLESLLAPDPKPGVEGQH